MPFDPVRTQPTEAIPDDLVEVVYRGRLRARAGAGEVLQEGGTARRSVGDCRRVAGHERLTHHGCSAVSPADSRVSPLKVGTEAADLGVDHGHHRYA
jgi:hypothetical protein